MGEWFDRWRRARGCRGRRIARAEAAGRIPPALLSFMSESRRLVNRRTGNRRLCIPTVYDGVPHLVEAA
jgi:hypothetical protein